MPIEIHGKQYVTVAERVAKFREDLPIATGWGIVTEIISQAEDAIVMRAHIHDPEGHVVACGHAEEKFGTTQINQTSAVENCETSAIGRALAACGYGGTEYASANEVQNAIGQQVRQFPKFKSENSKQKERVAKMPVEGPPEDQREEWHNCVLHFGKHEGVKLCQIPKDDPENEKEKIPQYLVWLQHKWKPKYDSPKNKHLREMLDQSLGKVDEAEAVEEPAEELATEDIPF
jgi:hypothetical protein